MTTQASGMTGDADASQATPGVTLAGGGSGPPQAQPVAIVRSSGATADLARDRVADALDTSDRPMLQLSDADRKALQRSEAGRRWVNGQTATVHPVIDATGSSPHRATAARTSPVGERSTPLDAEVLSARRLLGEMTQEAIFALIKVARTAVAEPEPSATSQKDYAKKVDLLRRASVNLRDVSEAQRWQQTLFNYAGRHESFKAYRAALSWHLRGELRERLKAQDRLQRTGERGDSWREEVAEVKRLFDVYETIHTCSRHDAPGIVNGGSRPSLSKKHALREIARKYPKWRSMILSACARSPYADAIQAMSLVGCRPEEVVTGILLSINSSGKVHAFIQGAKVTHQSGQSWRNIPLDLSKLPGPWLEALEIEGSYRIDVKSKDGLRNYLQRLSAKTLPGVPAVTAYVFRHALVGELRAGGAQAEEIASVLGHRVSETQAAYGPRGRRSRGQRAPKTTMLDVKAISVATPIRPLDRSGLSKIKGEKRVISR